MIVLVVGFLLYASWPFLARGELHFLMAREWYPYEDLYGFAPALVGSFWSVVLALLIAIPVGIAAAVFSAELLPGRWSGAARFGMELLAGVPSVVYGLLGLWILLPFIEGQLDLLTGRSLLAAGLLLAVMVLPTVMVMSEDALRGVAGAQRETAMNLGLGWGARLLRVLLPQAWPGIRSAVLLGMGRTMGETIAVMLVVGSIDRLPAPWYNLLQPAQTLTSRIGREMSEAALGSVHWAALMTIGLILALAAMGLAALAHAGRRGA